MARLPGADDPLPRRSWPERTALGLGTLLLSAVISWFGTLEQAKDRLASAGRALQPVLSAQYPGIDPEPFYQFSPGFRLSILTPETEILLTPGPDGDRGGLTLPSLTNPGQSFTQEGRLYYLFPVHEPGQPQANAILSLPLSQLVTPFARRTLGLLFLISLFRIYRHRSRAQAAVPRQQLLEEIKALRTDSIDRKVRLPLGNPFKPVADTLNQLLASRDRKDRQLQEQHHQQQVLLNNMSEGILTLDNDQRITGINPAAARWLNLGNAQRVRGELFYTVCRIPRLLQMIEGVSSFGLQEEFLRLERPGREDRIVKIKGSPLIDQDQTMGVLLVLQDVTTLRRLETLRQDFVSNVTHELRTPLSAIKGYTELLQEEPDLSEEMRGFLDRILKQSSRMIQIIEDLLSLTRIEDAEETPSLSRSELKPIFESVAGLCEEQLRLRDLTLVIDCPDTLEAELHPPLFEQAVHNLVHNAVKYTIAGTTITVRARAEDGVIRMEVEDQGPGIPEMDQPRIFERFYRVDKARSRAIGGTGLGLSIVKHVVLMHQGELGVTSTPGEGATFWIEIPDSAT